MNWKNGDAFLSQSTGACFKSSPNILDQILRPEENPVDPVVSALRKKMRKQQGKRKLIEDSTLPHTKTPQLRLHTNPLLLVEACVDRCVDCVDWWEKSLSAQTPNPQRPLECFEHFEGALGRQMLFTFFPQHITVSNSQVDTWFTVMDWSRRDYSIFCSKKLGTINSKLQL